MYVDLKIEMNLIWDEFKNLYCHGMTDNSNTKEGIYLKFTHG